MSITRETKFEVFPAPQIMEFTNGDFRPTEETSIYAISSSRGVTRLARYLQDEVRKRCGRELKVEVGDAIVDRGVISLALSSALNGSENLPAEGYTLSVNSKRVAIAGGDERGLYYGIQTLLQLMEYSSKALSFRGVSIRDWPYKKFRGVHLYLPAREEIPFFKRFIELISSYKMNLAFIELAGGMEFERHPEINKRWVEYIAEVRAYPGGPRGVQASQGYWKDSIHVDVAGGSYLTKDEVRELVQFMRDHYIEPIPEVQTFGHNDWMLQSHRELAERLDDPFPDTYCPSNPKTYELLEELMDEVIEVFEPEWVHIGHDEIYHIGLCPRCKGKSGAELLAGDVKRLHDYLEGKGIKTVMWGDKLLNFTAANGVAYGGVERNIFDKKTGVRHWMPATYEAIDMIPRDILISDWYWSLYPKTEDQFGDRGFEVIFGNFYGPDFVGWAGRASKDFIKGGAVSMWAPVSEFGLGRDGKIFTTLYSADMLWSSKYNDSDWDDLCNKLTVELVRARGRLNGGKSPLLELPTDEGSQIVSVDLTEYVNGTREKVGEWTLPAALPLSSPLKGLLTSLFEGNVLPYVSLCAGGDRSSPVIEVREKVKSLVFLHSSTAVRPFFPGYSGKSIEKENQIGSYRLIYSDSTEEVVDLIFGINIGNFNMNWSRQRQLLEYYKSPDWLGSLMYFTIPFSNSGKGETVYLYEWVNPQPDKVIERLEVVPGSVANEEILLFGIFGIRS